MGRFECRACRSTSGQVVLDLGEQPACDYFPPVDVSGPDQVYPLQMWLCSRCGLAQLVADPTVSEEPKGVEPAALVAQAKDAVRRVVAAGLVGDRATVAEYGSPHGGSWVGLLADQGLVPARSDEPAELIIDCFGMMHAADQATALAERVARVARDGVLLLQYHSLDTIVRKGQWNILRHGHYAYYSTSALNWMLASVGFSPRTAWKFELYGGTVLLAARRDIDLPGSADQAVRELLAAEADAGLLTPAGVSDLQQSAREHAQRIRCWLASAHSEGRTVVGYGAASRAVALLRLAGIDSELLTAVADASPAKQRTRMPGTSIPIISPDDLVQQQPDAVLVFVSDLTPEIRASYPAVEASGGTWVDADAL